MADDAAKIVNEAAARKQAAQQHRVEVLGAQQRRNPYRELKVAVIDVPPCKQYPQGVIFYCPVRQIQQHLKLYPGSRVLRIERKVMQRKLHDSGIRPKGHDRDQTFLRGKRLIDAGT
jgi:hypothetical protein